MSKRIVAWLSVVLAPAALAAKDPDVRKLGAKCLEGRAKECAALAKLAQSDSTTVREAAIPFVTDPAALAAIARNDISASNRLLAVNKLTDQAVLVDIVRKDTDDKVRRAAVDRITDQALLATLAQPPGDEQVRYAALDAIADEALLARLGSELPDKPSTKFVDRAVDLIAAKLTDQKLLAELARSAPSEHMRRRARYALTDQAVLVELAKVESDGYFAERAVAMVTDQALLGSLAQEATLANTRRAAIRTLRDVPVLTRIAGSDRDASVRQAATRRLAVVKEGVVVTGTLTETTLGVAKHLPIALGAIKDTVPVAHAVTDADGRFAFEAVAPGEWFLHYNQRALSGARGFPTANVPAQGRVDMGTLQVDADALVTSAHGSLCAAKGKTTTALPATNLLVFSRIAGGRWSHDYKRMAYLNWTPPWKAAVCITWDDRSVGTYVNRSGGFAGSAKQSTWNVRVIRLDTGESFETVATGAPPVQTTYSSLTPASEPTQEVSRWLRTLK